jgi:hypothetical protein
MKTTTRFACMFALLGAAIGATAAADNDRRALQVNDDNGRAIGLLAPATGGPNMVALFDRGVRGGPVVAIPLTAKPTSAKLWYFQDYVFFSNGDCTGTAFFWGGVAGVRPARVVSISGKDLLYVADSMDVDEQVSPVQSFWLGTCNPNVNSVHGYFKASKPPLTLNFVQPFKVK